MRPENPDTGMSPHQPLLPDVPPELAGRRPRLRTLVLFFGPGAIIASLTVGGRRDRARLSARRRVRLRAGRLAG